jgi:hypothetical protein
VPAGQSQAHGSHQPNKNYFDFDSPLHALASSSDTDVRKPTPPSSSHVQGSSQPNSATLDIASTFNALASSLAGLIRKPAPPSSHQEGSSQPKKTYFEYDSLIDTLVSRELEKGGVSEPWVRHSMAPFYG